MSHVNLKKWNHITNTKLREICEVCYVDEHPASARYTIIAIMPIGWTWSAIERGAELAPNGAKFAVAKVRATKSLIDKFEDDRASVALVKNSKGFRLKKVKKK